MSRLRRAAVALVLVATGAHAHHAWTEIDTGRSMTLQGTVKLLHWENPHASLLFETVDDAGRPTQWTVLLSGVARMESRHVTQDVIAQGRALTIVASPSRRVEHVVRANTIRADGHDYVLY